MLSYRTVLTLLGFVTGISAFFLCIIGVVIQDVSVLLVAICCVLLCGIVYSLRDIRNRISITLFSISFSLFLIGRLLINYVNGDDWFKGSMMFMNLESQKFFVVKVLLIAYTSFFLMTVVCDKKSRILNSRKRKICPKRNHGNDYLQISAGVLSYCTWPIYTLTIIEKSVYVIQNGYRSYYIGFNSIFPSIITKIAEVYHVFFFFYLATFPSKEKSHKQIILYLFVGVLSLFTGQRNKAVLSFLFVLFYFQMRNAIDDGGRKWMSKRSLIIIIALVPLLLGLLQIVGSVRAGSFSTTSDGGYIKNFCIDQGSSVCTIAYENILHDQFPTGHLYSLTPVLKYFKYSMFSNILGFSHLKYEQHTVSMALNGFSYGQTMTYLVTPYNYLAGIGLGSCYIAEAFHDFSYFGIICVSSMYAIILMSWKTVFLNCYNRPVIICLYFTAWQGIIYAPRDEVFSFLLNGALSISCWIAICFIYILARIIKNKFGKQSFVLSEEEK